MMALIPRPLRVLLLVGAVLLGIAWALVLDRRRPDAQPTPLAEPELPVLADAGTFALTNVAGHVVDSTALRGKVWTANVFFTTCPSICPALMGNLAAVQTAFADTPRVATVSVTIDPETDSQDVLAAYAAARGMDSARWHLLRGPMDDVQRVTTAGWRLGAMDDPINHSVHVVLIDQAGQIRGFYDGLKAESIQQLIADIRVLLAQTPAVAATPSVPAGGG